MLYIVSTPIGNLEDISYRQAKTLSESEIILAEDTRSTRTLIQGIKEIFGMEMPPFQKVISYYKDNEFEKLPEVLEMLRDGRTISLVSDAGTPLISDPGFLLMKHVIKNELPYTVIPGPSAVITSLIHSGINPQNSMFVGFLPKKPADIRKLLKQVMKVKETMDVTVVFFESPHRINKTLLLIDELLPESQLVICREMTKKFEEVLRGSAKDLFTHQYKGELTVVLH